MTPEPQYEIVQGLKAVEVDGPENLLRQGEYYTTRSVGYQALIMKCPQCRADNLIPRSVKYRKANWLQRLLGFKHGLTISENIICYACQYGVRVVDSTIFISHERILQKA